MIIRKTIDIEIDEEDICREFDLQSQVIDLEHYVEELEKECYIYSEGCKRTPKSILEDLKYILKGV